MRASSADAIWMRRRARATGSGPRGQDLVERRAVDQLHRDVGRALVLVDFVDGDDVRMVQRRRGTGLAYESPASVRSRRLGRQDLDRDGRPSSCRQRDRRRPFRRVQSPLRFDSEKLPVTLAGIIASTSLVIQISKEGCDDCTRRISSALGVRSCFLHKCPLLALRRNGTSCARNKI